MKYFAILIMVFATLTVYSQDDKERDRQQYRDTEYKTLFDRNSGFGGYGALSLGGSLIDGRNAITIGGRGMWIIAQSLGIGFGGYGFMNEPELDFNDNLYYGHAGGYGGLILEPIVMGRWPIHLAFPTLLGVGGVSLISYDQYLFSQMEPNEAYYEDASIFLIAEPGAELEINLLRWLRLSAYGTYRFTTNLVMLETSRNALSGWSGGLTLKVGLF